MGVRSLHQASGRWTLVVLSMVVVVVVCFVVFALASNTCVDTGGSDGNGFSSLDVGGGCGVSSLVGHVEVGPAVGHQEVESAGSDGKIDARCRIHGGFHGAPMSLLVCIRDIES